MGGSTRLKFPLPHRRSKKQPSLEVQSISAPMTNKAQKLLGSAEISIDSASPTSPPDHSKIWDTRSAVSGVSGFSVTVSETTAAAPASVVAESTVAAGTNIRGKATWDQESDIIPRGLGLIISSAARSHNQDITTDASSLRRRRSSSTIVSYYDKTKLPLSISQQTSSSLMAKGVPEKKAGPLDMECPRPAPAPPTMHRKKPSRLDLSSKLSRFSQKGKENMNLVLGSDLFTRSPSLMSTSPALSSPSADSEPKSGRLRRKLTKESLKGHYSGTRWSSFSSEPAQAEVKAPLRQRATETGNLNQLYEHYEQTSFRDTADYTEPNVVSENHPTESGPYPDTKAAVRKGSRQSASAAIPSPSLNKPRHHASPSFSSVAWRPAYSPDEGCGPIAENPRVSATSSNLASPAGDYSASVSSRHTRTSRASKTTESSANFDYNATSVLSLSSDSEDDDAELQRTATSKSSVGSRDSLPNPIDLRRKESTTSSVSVEPPRTQLKSRFRNSMGSQTPFLAIPEDEGAKGGSQPKINPRTSSLSSGATANNSPRPSISTVASSVRSQSRLSQLSMSTSESVPTHFSRPRSSLAGASPKQTPEINHIAMQSRTVTPTPTHHHQIHEKHQGSPLTRLSASPKQHPTPPMSPSSMEFVIRGQHDSTPDHKGPILTLSGEDHTGEERFIAVTPQEEMLLSAMRAKRAMMRENQHSVEMEAGARSQGPVKKESLSSIKTVKTNSLEPETISRALLARNSSKKLASALRFPEPRSVAAHSAPLSVGLVEEEDILVSLDRAVSSMDAYENAEPSPDLSDFIIDFDAEQFPAPPKTMHSRDSSTASAAGRLTHSRKVRHHRQSSFGRPRPDSEFLPETRHASPVVAPPLPSHKGVDLDAMTSRGKQVPIPSSSPTFTEQESQKLPSRKKAVRISAVGLAPPEIGQWGDDG